MMRKINAAGLELIKRFEGLRLEAYLCPAGVLTIGYGHTEGVKEGQKITEHQADVILDFDLARFEAAVERLAPLANDNEFAAMVSFAFNLGVHRLEQSNLLKKFSADDLEGACREFGKFVYGGGKVLPGLVARRAAEAELFLRPV